MPQDVTPPGGQRQKPKQNTTPKDLGTTALSADVEQPADSDVEFKTPDEIAATEDTNNEPSVASHVNTSKSKRSWHPVTREQWVIFSTVVVLLFGCGGAVAWALSRPRPAPAAPKSIVKKPVQPKVIYSNLSGLPITDASLNSKPVTAVMVENSIAARPQSGLSAAGVVFEAQAEGGVTRYMALYQDTAPTNVGPIRSARPYYIQWALGFDAAYAHVGGSPDALSDIKVWGVHDMNQFYNSSFYHRISTRPAPHNVYTGIPTLNQLESKKGFTSSYTGFPRANTAAPMSQPTASSISLAVSGSYYNPSYSYDASTNSYNRDMAGSPQIDAGTGKQVSPSVVIAIVLPLSRGALDATGAYYSDYNPLGSGTAYVFQNGDVTVGQWHKADDTSQLTFTDTNVNSILLNRGQTWITAVAKSSQVTYKSASH